MTSACQLLGDVRGICLDLVARPTLDQIAALMTRLAAIEDGRPAYPGGPSAREVEVLRLVVQGLPTAAIAERSFLSPRMVKPYTAAIFGELGMTNRRRHSLRPRPQPRPARVVPTE